MKDTTACSFAIVSLPSLEGSRIQPTKTLYDQHYAKLFPGIKTGLYRPHDWQRIEHALSLIPETCQSVLDVGTGPGALLNHLTLEGNIPIVTGIDLREYSKFYQIAEILDWRRMDVRSLTFADRAYDVVICMEVLEHLEPTDFSLALSELRRVAKRRLIATVPFNEPLPLPKYHKQRFDEQRVRSSFPGAHVSLLRRSPSSDWYWALIIEDR